MNDTATASYHRRDPIVAANCRYIRAFKLLQKRGLTKEDIWAAIDHAPDPWDAAIACLKDRHRTCTGSNV